MKLLTVKANIPFEYTVLVEDEVKDYLAVVETVSHKVLEEIENNSDVYVDVTIEDRQDAEGYDEERCEEENIIVISGLGSITYKDIRVKIGSKVVLRPDYGKGVPIEATVTQCGYHNGEQVIDYDAAEPYFGGWAYMHQIEYVLEY